MKPMKRLELLEGGIEMKKQPAKLVNIVSLMNGTWGQVP